MTAAPAASYANANGDGVGRQAVAYAAQLIGIPYVYGGESLSGMDCSGLVQYVYDHLGVTLPRTSQQQAGAGQQVAYSAAQPGDLLLYNEPGEGANSHVAIYAGNGQEIEAPHPGAAVRWAPVDMAHLSSVVRPLSNSAQGPSVQQADIWSWLKALGDTATGDPFVPGGGPNPNTQNQLANPPSLGSLGLGDLGTSIGKTAVTAAIALGAVALIAVGLYRGTTNNPEGDA